MNELKLPSTKGVLVSGLSDGGAAEDVKVEKQQKQEKKGAEQLA